MPPKAKPKPKAKASPKPAAESDEPPAKAARSSGGRVPKPAPELEPASDPEPAPAATGRPKRGAAAKPAPKAAKPKPKPAPKRGVKRKAEDLPGDEAEPAGEEEADAPDEAVAEPSESPTTAAGRPAAPRKRPPVDASVPSAADYEVVEVDGEFLDATLNQTNIGQNNNKYYIIQLLRSTAIKYHEALFLWTRWGRVGEDGQHDLAAQTDLEKGKAAFKKKFLDKTGNKWEARENFTKKSGKYDLVDVAEPEEEDNAQPTVVGDKKVRPSELPKEIQRFLELIFDQDMFKDSMKAMNIDTRKMPLGKLSKTQVDKGFRALEELEAAVKENATASRLEELTSLFYTAIPHDFGRSVPTVLKTEAQIREKFDLLNTLHDIAVAQQLQKEGAQEAAVLEEIDHPLDSQYKALQCPLTHVPEDSDEWRLLSKYFDATGPGKPAQVLQIMRMDRSGEKERFSHHSELGNRRLLWHGTNVAVVAAILRTGLRIMPHSGGRVGAGIYFASESRKSYGYVRPATTASGRIGIMFLNEVALGKEHTITSDDWSIKAPPAGHDCVIARGVTEPNPADDTKLAGEYGDIAVPQGVPIPTQYTDSRFSQSEYLVYKESQVRMKYVLMVKMNY